VKVDLPEPDGPIKVPAQVLMGAAPAPAPTLPPIVPSPPPTPSPLPSGSAQRIVWTSVSNATVTGSSVRKSSGCDGCDDAGAVSQQLITGDGYMQFTVAETMLLRSAGLKLSGSPTINFALRFQTGWVEVREGGIYRADVPISPGDVFRIAVQSGVVRYYRNGVSFYTSGVGATFPLYAVVALLDLNAAIENPVIAAF